MEENRITVLYVDDEIPLLEIGKAFLERYGNFSVSTSSSARKALEALASGSYDAIVSDYMMPEMDGIALLQEVRREFGDIPFILFTGRGREEIVVQAINEGVDFYIQKGGDPKSQFAELVHKIRQAVRRKEAEHNLRQSEQRYRSIVQDQTEMIVRFSPDGLITFSNEAYREYFVPLLGLDEVVGKNIRNIMQFKNFDMVEKFLDSLTFESPVRDMERMVTGPDGVNHWQLYTVRSLFDENGEKVEFQVVGRDITERKLIEEKLLRVLEENRERLEEEIIISEFSQFLIKATSPEEVLDHFGEIIYERSGADYLVLTKLDPETETVGFHSFFGLSPFLAEMNSMIQENFESIRVSMDYITVHQGKGPFEPGLRRVEGGIYEVSLGYIPKIVCLGLEKLLGIKRIYTFEFVWNGKYYGSVNFAYRSDTDISNSSLVSTLGNLLANGIWRIYSTNALVHDRESLKASEERYRTIVETAQEGILIFDPDYRIVSINGCMADLLGYTPEEMKGRMITDFLDPMELPDHELNAAKRKKGERERFERRFLTRDGRNVWGLVSSTPLFSGSEFAGTFAMVTDITERKLAEAWLLESEELHRKMITAIPDIVVRTDLEGRIIFINEKGGLLSGLHDPAELIGKSVYQFFAPESLPAAVENAKLMFEHPLGPKEYMVVAADNRHIPLEVNGDILYTPEGNPSGMIYICRDITERKQAEEAFRQSEASYRGLFNTIQQAIYILDGNGRFVDVNRGAEKMYGYSREEFLGKTPEFLSAPGMNNMAEVADRIRKAYSGELQKFGFWGLRKNGEVFPKDVFLYNGLYFGQNVVIAIGVDITERKRMEDVLLEKTAMLEAQVESSIDGILIVNERNERILINRRLVNMWKVPPDILDDPDDMALLQFVVNQTRDPESFHRKVVYLYGHPEEISQDIVEFTDGRVYDRYSAPVVDRSGRLHGRIWIFRDITENRKAEEALRQANKKLSLLSGITRHDILNQLTSLLGYLTLSLDEIQEGQVSDYLKRSRSLTQTIQRQIMFTRVYEDIGSQSPLWQNVEEIIRKVLRDLPSSTLSCHMELNGMMIYADSLLEKVFFTMVENTLRHGERATDIWFSYRIDDSGIMIIYRDNGVGIAAVDKQKIFDPGYGRNTGFGLFLSREILAITGMTIRETGESGNGAWFEILVPKGTYRFA